MGLLAGGVVDAEVGAAVGAALLGSLGFAAASQDSEVGCQREKAEHSFKKRCG